MRDPMRNQDIEGAHAKKFKVQAPTHKTATEHEIRQPRLLGPAQGRVPHSKDGEPFEPSLRGQGQRRVGPHVTRRNPVGCGEIEGCRPKGIPMRKTGETSTDLKTQDILGAQAGTRGLGMFAERQREHFRNQIPADDIEGAHVGTMKNG